MSVEPKGTSMSDGRALLTDREREALETDESGSYRYKTRSYIRNRIERLEADAELLADAEPDLFEELREAVCDVDTDGDVQPPADGRESGVTPSEEPADELVGGDPEPASEGDSGEGSAAPSTPAAALRDVDFPAGTDRDECVDAIIAARRLLRDRGSASKAEIVREVMPERSVGYDPDAALEKLDAGDRYRGAWWRKVVAPGLEALADVDKPAPGRSKWQYTGGDE